MGARAGSTAAIVALFLAAPSGTAWAADKGLVVSAGVGPGVGVEDPTTTDWLAGGLWVNVWRDSWMAGARQTEVAAFDIFGFHDQSNTEWALLIGKRRRERRFCVSGA